MAETQARFAIVRRLVTPTVVAALTVVWVFSSFARAHDQNWDWVNPLPQGCTLMSVWGASPDDVFAVGRNGAIVHYDGSSWRSMVSSTSTDHHIWSIRGTDRTNVYAAGSYGKIYHYDGASWSRVDSGTYRDLHAVWVLDEDNVFVVGEAGTILRLDGGSWIAMNSQTEEWLGSIWGTSSTNVWAVGANGLILHFDGTAWSAAPSPASQTLSSIWGSGEDDIFAVGQEGAFHFDGTSWSRIGSLPGASLSTVWGVGSGDVYALGRSGSWQPGVFHYDGTSWALELEDTSSIYDIWGSDSTHLITVGGGGRILRREGTTWGEMVAGATTEGAYIHAVLGFAPDDIYAIGGEVMRHFDGTSWVESPLFAHCSLFGAWGTGPNDIYAVGSCGSGGPLIVHWDGVSWSTMDPGTDSGLYAVWGCASDDVYAVGHGDDGVIVHYDGASWREVVSGSGRMFERFEGVWGSSCDDVFVVGYFLAPEPDSNWVPVVLHYDGATWRDLDPPPTSTISAVWGTGPSSLFVAGSRHIYHFDGSGWTDTGYIKDWVTAFWGLSDENLYATTAENGGSNGAGGHVYRYDGTRWNRMASDPVNPLFGVWGTGKGDVYAVGINDTILHHVEEFYPRIGVSDTVLDFGRVKIGQTSETLTLAISNSGISILDIGSVALSDAGSPAVTIVGDGCSGRSLFPSSACPVELSFSPTFPGSLSSRLLIPSDDPYAPTVAVRISGVGALFVDAPEPAPSSTD